MVKVVWEAVPDELVFINPPSIEALIFASPLNALLFSEPLYFGLIYEIDVTDFMKC